MTDWQLDRTGAVDDDGWTYANDFNMLKSWPPTTGSNYENGSMLVRRRRWMRLRQRKDVTKNVVISLGTLEPHSTIACPIEILRSCEPDYVVQFKPRVGSVYPGVACNWSSVASCKGNTEPGRGRPVSKELRIRGLRITEEL